MADQAPDAQRVARLAFARNGAAAVGLPVGFACKKAWASIYADADRTRPRGVETANITKEGDNIVADISITQGQEEKRKGKRADAL